MLEVPATSAITRKNTDDSSQTIYSCQAHVMQTLAVLGKVNLEITQADPSRHSCKGCNAGWPI